MNKKELAEIISKKASFKEKDVSKIIDMVFDEIVDSVKEGKEVKIFGFGKFLGRLYGERKCYNPLTGEYIKLSPSIQPAFVPGPKFRNKINEEKR